jgi:hypothetical protein
MIEVEILAALAAPHLEQEKDTALAQGQTAASHQYEVKNGKTK